jgi:hypothetical protein
MRDFLIKMRRLDKTLFIKLDRARQRYVIYRKDRANFPREILVIEEDGQFAYPNYNHIVKLYQMDSWSNKNLIKDMDEYNDHLGDEGEEHIHYLSNELSKLATRSAYY